VEIEPMPTYEYECTECGVVFDLFQPITEPARRRLKKSDPKPCACNAPVARRIGTGGGIIFKGSGFYQTDYRSDGYKKAAEAEKGGGDGKGTKEPKSETKSADAGPNKSKGDGAAANKSGGAAGSD
jgi:putative FmdB family regulatory protein